jgi:CheY-like chemotaxis protein
MNILIVDDDVIILNLLKQAIFKMLNITLKLYNVDIAIGSKEALELYVKTKYDIVFLDYNFKNDIDGKELYYILKNKYISIFVCITGLNIEKYPFDDILLKPFSLKIFIELISKYAKTISEKN